jgi:hypothetical protein
MYYVYLHYRLDTGECFYIGKGTQPRRARVKDGRNNLWQKVYNKAGRKVIIAEYFQTEQEALDFEKDMIKRYNPLANITEGGEGVSGLKHTEDTKLKCRAATVELRNDPKWLSRNLQALREVCSTEEHRQNLSEIGKARFEKNPAARENMRIKQKLFIQNNPEKQALRNEKSTQAKNLRENRIKNARSQGGKPFNVYKDGNLIGTYELMSECAEVLNLHKAAICKCLKGIQPAHKGYTFSYLTGEQI